MIKKMVGAASFLVGLLVMVQSVPSSSHLYPLQATPHEDDAKIDTTTTTSPVPRTALSSFSRPSANTTIEQVDLLIDDVFPKGHPRHEYYDTHYEEEDEVGRQLRINKGHRVLAPAPSTGNLKNLVVLVRFSDHTNRPNLPTAAEMELVFNHEGSHHKFAPTGSVRDFYNVNSYGKLNLTSTVYGWIDLPETEAYYANGQQGFATKQYVEALHSAMNDLQQQQQTNLKMSDFDGNNDGKVDMVTLVHSGYASESTGADPDGAVSDDRIWSHHRQLPRKNRWYSDQPKSNGGGGNNDAYIYQYGTVSAFYGNSGSTMGRIGVISHELGHAIGLPDLYGKHGGSGIGSYDLMSNHWGFPQYYRDSQLYPPIMSPWTKMKVGWIEPTVITEPGTYTVKASQSSAETIYKINIDETGEEYLLIENRQAVGYDLFLPQGGLAIWHIDETASNKPGYPGQEGDIPWPLNQQHYKVALLQADGAYDLETGLNNGDKFDLFHADGVDALAPSINYLDGPHPNTDSYRDQVPTRTGIWINNISKSDTIMSFRIDFMNELATAFLGGNGAPGTMFDIVPSKDITIRKLYLNIGKDGPMNVELWMRIGTHVNNEKKPWKWQRQIVAPVEAQGKGMRTSMDVGSVELKAGQRYGIYLLMLDGRFRYTNGGEGVGTISASNDDLTIYEGVGLARVFSKVYKKRIWNGHILYDVADNDDDESDSNTRRHQLRGRSL